MATVVMIETKDGQSDFVRTNGKHAEPMLFRSQAEATYYICGDGLGHLMTQFSLTDPRQVSKIEFEAWS